MQCIQEKHGNVMDLRSRYCIDVPVERCFFCLLAVYDRSLSARTVAVHRCSLCPAHPESNTRMQARHFIENVVASDRAVELQMDVVQIIAKVLHETVLYGRGHVQAILAHTLEHSFGPLAISLILSHIAQELALATYKDVCEVGIQLRTAWLVTIIP